MGLEQVVFLECKAMVKYALGSGQKIPLEIVENINKQQQYLNNKNVTEKEEKDNDIISPVSIGLLNKAHYQLSKIVAPAKPKTLALFDAERKDSFFNFLGPVALIRRMMFIAIFSLIALICLSVSPEVNGTPNSFSLTGNEGTSLLINQLFLMSAASIGASFAALFQVNQYIKNSNYDPTYESTYWVRFVLGILAGSMLATLIPVDSFVNSPTTADVTQSTNMGAGFGIPLLALIGGFSASVVFRILTRLTTAVESIFKGDTKELISSMETTYGMKMEQQHINTKLQLISELKGLHEKISSNSDSKELMNELNKIQNKLMDNETK